MLDEYIMIMSTKVIYSADAYVKTCRQQQKGLRLFSIVLDLNFFLKSKFVTNLISVLLKHNFKDYVRSKDTQEIFLRKKYIAKLIVQGV